MHSHLVFYIKYLWIIKMQFEYKKTGIFQELSENVSAIIIYLILLSIEKKMAACFTKENP